MNTRGNHSRSTVLTGELLVNLSLLLTPKTFCCSGVVQPPTSWQLLIEHPPYFFKHPSCIPQFVNYASSFKWIWLEASLNVKYTKIIDGLLKQCGMTLLKPGLQFCESFYLSQSRNIAICWFCKHIYKPWRLFLFVCYISFKTIIYADHLAFILRLIWWLLMPVWTMKWICIFSVIFLSILKYFLITLLD